MKKLSVCLVIIMCLVVGMVKSTVHANSFNDVPTGMYYSEAVFDFAERGIVGGVGNNNFAPNQYVTRGAVAKIIVGLLGLDVSNVPPSNFKDVPTTHMFYKEISMLKSKGIINGYENNMFLPSKTISREEATVIISKAFNLTTETATQTPFSDVKGFFAPYIQSLYGKGIVNGVSQTRFDGKGSVTRGQIVTFLSRAEKYVYPNGRTDAHLVMDEQKLGKATLRITNPERYTVYVDAIQQIQTQVGDTPVIPTYTEVPETAKIYRENDVLTILENQETLVLFVDDKKNVQHQFLLSHYSKSIPSEIVTVEGQNIKVQLRISAEEIKNVYYGFVDEHQAFISADPLEVTVEDGIVTLTYPAPSTFNLKEDTTAFYAQIMYKNNQSYQSKQISLVKKETAPMVLNKYKMFLLEPASFANESLLVERNIALSNVLAPTIGKPGGLAEKLPSIDVLTNEIHNRLSAINFTNVGEIVQVVQQVQKDLGKDIEIYEEINKEIYTIVKTNYGSLPVEERIHDHVTEEQVKRLRALVDTLPAGHRVSIYKNILNIAEKSLAARRK